MSWARPFHAVRGMPSSASPAMSSSWRRGPSLRSARTRPHRAVHVDAAQQRRGRAQVPLLATRTRRDGEGPVVGCRHHVDRGAHDGRLDDGPVLQRPGQRRPVEVLEPAPQADVARRGVLRLEAGDRFERLGQRQVGPLEQELPGEERAVQAALGQDGVGHRLQRSRAAASPSSRPTRAIASARRTGWAPPGTPGSARDRRSRRSPGRPPSLRSRSVPPRRHGTWPPPRPAPRSARRRAGPARPAAARLRRSRLRRP